MAKNELPQVSLPDSLSHCTPEQKASIVKLLGFSRQVAAVGEYEWGVSIITYPDAQKYLVCKDGTVCNC